MTGIPFGLPSVVPPALTDVVYPPPMDTADPFSLYDVAIGGVGFEYATTVDNPLIRQTVPFEKNRIDQESSPGEQTLTGWWIRSQDSFHGGAGQLNLEPSIPQQMSHVRFDVSKNVDVSIPGRLTRLPDTHRVSSLSPDALVGLLVAGHDALVVLHGGTATLLTDLDSISPTVANFTAVSGLVAIETDGALIYCADSTHIYALDPTSTTTKVTLATLPATAVGRVTLGWVKARLMLGLNGGVYEVDVSTTGVTIAAGDVLYQHPSQGYEWTCFAPSPTAVLAGGHANGLSAITQFSVQNLAGAPVLQVDGEVVILPVGETLLSMENVLGTYMALGTSRGVRIGAFDTYYSKLTYGPLALTADLPVIPANAVVTRGHFVYAAGMDYDEAGLLVVDVGTQSDDAGRFAWAPNLVTADTLTGLSATSAVVTPSTRLAFGVPSHGVYYEGVGSGTVRESWLRTSRIRFDTTEPKLFKLGRVRGVFDGSEVRVDAITPIGQERVITVGFTSTDPDEFRLPQRQSEWLQYRLELVGAQARVTSYQAKALPGTHRQRMIRAVLAIYDTETTKSGQRIRDELSARARLDQLEGMDTKGDEVVFQEFTPAGVVSTIVVIDSLEFQQIGRPTRRSDLGGSIAVTLRTVES